MKLVYLIIIVILYPILLSGQINYTVKGKILTAGDYAPSGNIIALQKSDSTFIKGDFFLDGNFELSGLQEEELIIQFNSLEFDDTFVIVKYEEETIIELGTFYATNSKVGLDEVVIRSRRPVYTIQADGTMSVTIANTTLESSNSVSEILSKSPDVLVDENGNISIFGKGDAIIYLNNKRITNDQLAMISPSTINKIEVIRNPSAKYDAEGGAVINIITRTNDSSGYQVNLKQNISDSDFAGLQTLSSASMNFNQGPFSFFVNYSFLQGDERNNLHTTRDRDAEEVFIKTDVLTEWINKYDNFSNYGLGTQYNYGDKSYISLEYAGLYEKLSGPQLNTNTIEEQTGINYFESDITRDELDKNNSLSLNIFHSLDTLGNSIFFGSQFSKYDNQANGLIAEDREELGLLSSRTLKNISSLGLDIYTAQVDVTKVLVRDQKLEYGAKYSHIGTNTTSEFLVSNNGIDFTLDTKLSNKFNYNESIFAGYFSYSKKISESLNYSIGLRSEYTMYDLNSLQLDDKNINDTYLNLFPNFSIGKKLSDNYNVNFSYSSRIWRVPYQRLNPTIIYQDPYTSIQGNPESISMKLHTLELNTKLKKTALKLSYNYILDPFGGGAIRGEDPKSYVLIRFNFHKRYAYLASASRTFENSWLSSTNTASLQYTNIIDNEHNFEQVGARPQIYIHSNNRIRVGDLFNMEMLFYLIGKEYQGVYIRSNSKSLNLSFDKKFLNDALTCRLIFNDLFHSVRAAGDYSIGETDIYFHRTFNTRYNRVSFIYNFGKLKNSNYKNKNVGQSESNRG